MTPPFIGFPKLILPGATDHRPTDPPSGKPEEFEDMIVYWHGHPLELADCAKERGFLWDRVWKNPKTKNSTLLDCKKRNLQEVKKEIRELKSTRNPMMRSVYQCFVRANLEVNRLEGLQKNAFSALSCDPEHNLLDIEVKLHSARRRLAGCYQQGREVKKLEAELGKLEQTKERIEAQIEAIDPEEFDPQEVVDIVPEGSIPLYISSYNYGDYKGKFCGEKKSCQSCHHVDDGSRFFCNKCHGPSHSFHFTTENKHSFPSPAWRAPDPLGFNHEKHLPYFNKDGMGCALCHTDSTGGLHPHVEQQLLGNILDEKGKATEKVILFLSDRECDPSTYANATGETNNYHILHPKVCVTCHNAHGACKSCHTILEKLNQGLPKLPYLDRELPPGEKYNVIIQEGGMKTLKPR